MNKQQLKQLNKLLIMWKEIHKAKYDYSKVEYVTIHTKVIIICPEHGEFEQTPNSHKRGSGCPNCGKVKAITSNTKTITKFISEANEVHNNLYSYNKAVYTNATTNINITCKEHGEFLQTPNNHLSGRGCPECSKSRDVTKLRKEFLVKAHELHDRKYDYSKILYINSFTPVEITCQEHGVFLQSPSAHIQGSGCPKCGKLQSALKNTLTTAEFIEKSKKIHGDIYDYSKTKYERALKPVVIDCPIHGKFEQIASTHLAGAGCKHCGEIKQRKKYYDKPTILYYVYLSRYDLYKIGITLKERGVKLRFGREFDSMEVVDALVFESGKKAYEAEQDIILKHSDFKYVGTNVLTSGNSELFTKDILEGTLKDYKDEKAIRKILE